MLIRISSSGKKRPWARIMHALLTTYHMGWEHFSLLLLILIRSFAHSLYRSWHLTRRQWLHRPAMISRLMRRNETNETGSDGTGISRCHWRTKNRPGIPRLSHTHTHTQCQLVEYAHSGHNKLPIKNWLPHLNRYPSAQCPVGDNGRRWTTMDDDGRRWTTMNDDERQPLWPSWDQYDFSGQQRSTANDNNNNNNQMQSPLNHIWFANRWWNRFAPPASFVSSFSSSYYMLLYMISTRFVRDFLANISHISCVRVREITSQIDGMDHVTNHHLWLPRRLLKYR